MITKGWTIIFLCICAITDIYERKVYTAFCIANGIVIGSIHFFMRDIGFINFALGLFLGICFLVITFLTRGAVGSGDGIVIGIVGMAIGFIETIEVLCWSLLLSVIVAIIGIISKKVNWKSKLPFVPFILTGFLITILINMES